MNIECFMSFWMGHPDSWLLMWYGYLEVHTKEIWMFSMKASVNIEKLEGLREL